MKTKLFILVGVYFLSLNLSFALEEQGNMQADDPRIGDIINDKRVDRDDADDDKPEEAKPEVTEENAIVELKALIAKSRLYDCSRHQVGTSMYSMTESRAFELYYEFIGLNMRIHEKRMSLPTDLLAQRAAAMNLIRKRCPGVDGFAIPEAGGAGEQSPTGEKNLGGLLQQQ